ncbi:regulator of protease activity HflC (stomatin/prohibitin superfamily) [Streptomyces sp. SAI-135]|uniref:SPFH domain-containing protein n=1 Tax=unclassified Streptomyces TaxID=2593676 RepID=UPI002473140B|nr:MULTISPECIES: SPFH domain-containing protein [unclassified Streptomyces]MDH6516772.1 regulator of protease activity HflC (stomatin/prohibitin superfamily) [Streptomyces sp. SAI-090]MDH6548987.1 regulator of protease activity HflC (stomatin/prohibitin superfamily) [Streptomyces sp. SAI-041]MDH6568055.1 regulator of protease activity HflC (stomatin/prohibitin superfamily) [Streptomyces sp. SAI-117]MDH6586996.1 regulator of protease activity HflC (stomatin/prohibitin superfamily) [Streptomyces 
MAMDESVPDMPAPRVREFAAHSIGGALALLLGLAGLLLAVFLFAASGESPGFTVGGVLVLIAALISLRGLNTVAPGEARVVQLFGRYKGTIRQDGLRWVNPFTSRTKVSTRVRNHETAVLKVNDAYGNPIELAAVVVWKVEDTAQATFEVDNFVKFVATQTETAVRHIAIEYPYDAHEEDGLSLRGNADEITQKLATELHARVESAGVQIIESRFTHLAYAPEIASAMLQRQQAGAVVAARRQIVEGAVGMVEEALARITERDIVELDEERKAAMVSNLMVVLCGDRAPQPVLNTGTLYQ